MARSPDPRLQKGNATTRTWVGTGRAHEAAVEISIVGGTTLSDCALYSAKQQHRNDQSHSHCSRFVLSSSCFLLLLNHPSPGEHKPPYSGRPRSSSLSVNSSSYLQSGTDCSKSSLMTLNIEASTSKFTASRVFRESRISPQTAPKQGQFEGIPKMALYRGTD